MAKQDSKYKLVGAPYPSLEKGKNVELRQTNYKVSDAATYDTSVTTACKYPKEAVMMLDYKYTDEGSKLFYYGVPGTTYTMNGSDLQLTDAVVNNDKKLPVSQFIKKHLMDASAFYRGEEKKIIPLSPATIQATEVWDKAGTSKMLPQIKFTAEENKEVTSIYNEMNTYINEMYLKFIMGQEPLDKFDSFVNELKSIGLDDILKIYQTAYERYQSN